MRPRAPLVSSTRVLVRGMLSTTCLSAFLNSSGYVSVLCLQQMQRCTEDRHVVIWQTVTHTIADAIPYMCAYMVCVRVASKPLVVESMYVDCPRTVLAKVATVTFLVANTCSAVEQHSIRN